MHIEQALQKHMEAQPDLAALVGGCIYYVRAPQDVQSPYLVFFKVSASRPHSHQGASGLALARFQCSCFAETYYSAKQLAWQLQGALQGFSGIMGGEVGVEVGGCFYDNEQDQYEPQTGLYHVAVDYLVWHRE